MLQISIGALAQGGGREDKTEKGRKDSLSFCEKYLSPGKADIFVKSTDNSTDYNFILWTPTIKGGFGYIDRAGAKPSIYGGGFVRPLQGTKHKGELILGGGIVEHHELNSDVHEGIYYEFQGEYRAPFGLAVAAGYINSPFFESPAGPPRTNDYFGKLSFRKKMKGWNFIVSALVQQFDTKNELGGYLAAHNDILSLAGGYEGESWRSSIGLIYPKKDSYFRPTLEVLYIDKQIGANEVAPKILWINGTMKFKGGFLSHPARLGRTMGATGLEYGNPLAYLVPLNDGNPLFQPGGGPTPAIWNRALNTWEIGGMFNARLFHLNLPNEAMWGKAEALAFPAQFFRSKNFLNNIFVGAGYNYFVNTPANLSDVTSTSVMAGFVQRVNSLMVALQAEQNLDNDNTILNVGIINWF